MYYINNYKFKTRDNIANHVTSLGWRTVGSILDEDKQFILQLAKQGKLIKDDEYVNGVHVSSQDDNYYFTIFFLGRRKPVTLSAKQLIAGAKNIPMKRQVVLPPGYMTVVDYGKKININYELSDVNQIARNTNKMCRERKVQLFYRTQIQFGKKMRVYLYPETSIEEGIKKLVANKVGNNIFQSLQKNTL